MTKTSKTTKSTKSQPQSKAKTKSAVTPKVALKAPVAPSEAPDNSQLAQDATTAVEPATTRRKPREAKQSTETAKKPRVERTPLVNLDPADAVKPVRAGTHLADVLALTARPEGATAVELDKAIVTTAKSVRHYGVWSLRYALHKQKGFGFRTVETDGEPARYLLVLPKGQELAAFLSRSASPRNQQETSKIARAKRREKAAGSEGDADMEPA